MKHDELVRRLLDLYGIWKLTDTYERFGQFVLNQEPLFLRKDGTNPDVFYEQDTIKAFDKLYAMIKKG